MSQQCKTVLDNGMTVISRTMPDVRSVSLGLWFNVGSRDERPDQAGLTHFMEHMMFKGTPTKGPLDISMHFDRLGAELNAFTSKEYTCYYARFVDDKLEDALSVLAEMVIESNFSQDAIDTEREVVIEEIARSEDTPDDYVYELYSQSNLPNHPCGLPVLGTRDRVGSYRHADCVDFHAEHYHAGNLTLAAAGNVDHNQLLTLAKRYFASMKPGKKELESFFSLNSPQVYLARSAISSKPILCMVYPGCPWEANGDILPRCSPPFLAVLCLHVCFRRYAKSAVSYIRFMRCKLAIRALGSGVFMLAQGLPTLRSYAAYPF